MHTPDQKAATDKTAEKLDFEFDDNASPAESGEALIRVDDDHSIVILDAASALLSAESSGVTASSSDDADLDIKLVDKLVYLADDDDDGLTVSVGIDFWSG